TSNNRARSPWACEGKSTGFRSPRNVFRALQNSTPHIGGGPKSPNSELGVCKVEPQAAQEIRPSFVAAKNPHLWLITPSLAHIQSCEVSDPLRCRIEAPEGHRIPSPHR